jgi:hypothetical protein
VQEESNKKNLSIINELIKDADENLLLELEYFYHLNGNNIMADKIRDIIHKRS